MHTVHVYTVHNMPGVVSSWQVWMSGDQQDRMYTVHVYMVYSIPGVVSSHRATIQAPLPSAGCFFLKATDVSASPERLL